MLRHTGSAGSANPQRHAKPPEPKKVVEKFQQPLMTFTKKDLEKAGERPLRPKTLCVPRR